MYYIAFNIIHNATKQIEIMTTFKIEITKLGCNIDGFETENEVLEVRSFSTLKEAKKEIRSMIKNEGFERLYNIYNQEENTELHTNF